MAYLVYSLEPVRYPRVDFVYNNPSSVRPVLNPIQVKYLPAPIGLGTPTKSEVNIFFNGFVTPLDGEFITIDSLIIYWRTNPQSGDIDATLSAQQQGYQLYSLLLNNPSITNIYDLVFTSVIATNWNINLKDKIAGKPQAIVTHNAQNTFSTVTVGLVGNVANTQADWGMYLDLYIDKDYQTRQFLQGSYTFNTPQFNFVFLERLQKNQIGNEVTTFDLSGVLENYLNYTAPRFDLLPALIQRIDNQIMIFGYEAGQFFFQNGVKIYLPSDRRGLDPSVIGSQAIGHFACYGGLPSNLNQIEIENEWNRYWIRDSGEGVKALSNQPKNKISDYRSREWLYFYYVRTPNEAFLTPEYKFSFDNGTEVYQFNFAATIPIPVDSGGAFNYEVSSIDLQAVEQANGSKIQSYQIRMFAHDLATPTSGSGAYATQPLSYSMQCENLICRTHFAQITFLNTLGGFDTIYCAGWSTAGLKTTSYEHDKTIDYEDYRHNRALKEIFFKRSYEIFELQTGMLSFDEYYWLKELLNSIKIFIQIEDMQVVPATLENSDFEAEWFTDCKPLKLTFKLNLEGIGNMDAADSRAVPAPDVEICGEDVDVQAIWQEMDNLGEPANQARKELICETVSALKQAGIWDKMYNCWFFGAHGINSSKINWKIPTQKAVSSGNADAGFTIDRGFAKVPGLVVNSFLSLASAANGLTCVAQKLKSVSIGFYNNVPFVQGLFLDDTVGGGDGGYYTFFGKNTTYQANLYLALGEVAELQGDPFANANVNYLPANGFMGLITAQRLVNHVDIVNNNFYDHVVYRNGAQVNTANRQIFIDSTGSSTGKVLSNVIAGPAQETVGGRCSFTYMCDRYLTQAEMTALYAIVQNYMLAIGAQA